MTNEQVEDKKDELYTLLHEFNRHMNYTGEKEPMERRAIKKKFVDKIFTLITSELNNK
jgi:16S rRNA G527 N7-methylase RsmG